MKINPQESVTQTKKTAQAAASGAEASPKVEGAETAPAAGKAGDRTDLPSGKKSRLELIDRNGDGVESDVEKKLAEGRIKARDLIAASDRDGDGKLQGEELDDATRGADRNGDGIVTQKELRRQFNGDISREDRFKGFDSDGNGVLEGKELTNDWWARGRDHDGDGKVTLEEFKTGRLKDQAASTASGTGPGTEGAAPVEGATGPSAAPAGNDLFAGAKLDRSQPAQVSWYHPHRQNETPTLRISGNVTSENFWREAALASMNVGMSPRRMASVLQEALPRALEGLGVKADPAALADTIRDKTSGLPRANPIPHHLHPDTTGKYLDDNPAAAGWRETYGPRLFA